MYQKSLLPYFIIVRNCDVLPIEYDLLFVMFVNQYYDNNFFFEPIKCLVINNMLPSNLFPVFSFRFFAWSRDYNLNIT
jgi:hypothetical protein